MKPDFVSFMTREGCVAEMLSDRLKDILAEREISVADFAEMCNLPVETVRNIYYGKTTDPKLSTVFKMASALKMSMNTLVGELEIDKEERRIVNYYRQCGTHGKAIIGLVAKYEATSARADRDSTDKHKVPCLIPHNDIREGIIYDTCETVEYETSVREAFVGVKITTNDLIPRFCKGDVILFADKFPKNGEYAAFIKGDRAFIRQFIEEDGKYTLKSLQKVGDDMVMKRLDQIEYIGTCIEVIRS